MKFKSRSLSLTIAALALAGASVSCSRSDKKATALEQAGRDFEAGAYDKAEIEYLKVIQLDPNDPMAADRLGTIYSEQGREARAVVVLTKAKQLQPDNVGVRVKLARALFLVGKAQEARTEANAVLDRWPNHPDAPILLAEMATSTSAIDETRIKLRALPPAVQDTAPIHVAVANLELRLRHLKQAEAELQKAQSLDPKAPGLNSALGTVYWVQHDLPHAEQALTAATENEPERSLKRISLAQFKVQNGDLAGARKLMEELTAKAPDYLPAWSVLGQIAATQKRYDDADAIVGKMLARDSSYPEALLLSGELKLNRGDVTKAIADFERLTKAFPQMGVAQYQLGAAYLSAGDSNRAAASLNRAISAAPTNADAIVLLAGINIQRGDYGSAIASLKTLVQQRPDLAQPRLVLASAYRSQGNLPDALATYRLLEKFFPGNPQTSWLTGLVLEQMKDKVQARQAFEHALELNGNYLPAVEQLVDLDLSEKRFDDAQKRLDPSIAKNPNVAGLYRIRAQIWADQNQNDEAETALKKAIQLDPSSPQAYISLANIYVSSHQDQKAITSLQDLLKKNPKEISVLMLMGSIYEQQKNYQGAQSSYEKLLEVDPKFGPALNNLAYIDSDQLNQLDKAYDLAKKAREVMPKEPNTADTLGWILYKKHQYTWAMPLLQEAVLARPRNAEMQFHIGMASYFAGQLSGAKGALEQALVLNPAGVGNNEAKQILAMLAIDPAKATSEQKALLERRATDHPEDATAISRLAELYQNEGAAEKASETYELALRASPDNPTLMIKLAAFQEKRGNLAKAYELAKAARKNAPDDPEVAHVVGRIAFRSGDHGWAASVLQEAANKDSDSGDTLLDLAQAQYSIGHVEDARTNALAALQKGATLTKTEEANRFLEMVALASQPNAGDDANTKVEQALKADSALLPALFAKAELIELRGDASNATAAYEQILKSYPAFSLAKKKLAALYLGYSQDLAKAYSLAMKAHEDLPNDAELNKTLGIILYRQNEFAKAVVSLKDAANTRVNDGEVLYYLGMTRYRLKDNAGAREALKRAMSLKLSSDQSAEANKILAELK